MSNTFIIQLKRQHQNKDEPENLSVPHSGSKIVELESIRGVAALLVVFFHMPGWHPSFYYIGFIRNSNLMVDLFFVLSGFVIYQAYSIKIRNKMDLIRFQFLRFGRLYPVHLLFLLLFLGVEFAKHYAETILNIQSSHTTPFKENNWIAFFQHLLLIQDIGPTGNGKTFNAPSWSISVEFYTYLIFGFIVLFTKKSKNIISIVIALVAITLLFTSLTPAYRDILRCLAGFFCGCSVASFYRNLSPKLPPYSVILVMLTTFVFLQFKPDKNFDVLIYLLAMLMIITIVASNRGYVSKVLRNRYLVWLGTISYSLYMSHVLIVWSINQVLRLVLKYPEKMVDGFMTPQLTFQNTLITYVLTMIAILGFSHLLYKYVETPYRSKSRTFAFKNIR